MKNFEIGTKVITEGKFDYEAGKRTYLVGTIIAIGRTLASHGYPAENEYKIQLDDGSTILRTEAFVKLA